MKDFFSTNITKKQSVDTGMAAVLLLLLAGFFTENVLLYKIAIPVLVINMITPGFFYPFAIVWLGFSQLLETVVSKMLLSLVYFLSTNDCITGAQISRPARNV